ncbi:MAG: MarR family transcriptional regulator [Saprospiraceae bacterium]|nr:MarR family transcriptional regulator [Saprospiraceae bacterium]
MEKLNDTFFYNLEKTVKTYRQYFQNQLKAHGFDITLDQWLILSTLIKNPDISQNDIAEKVFKDKASVTRIIELLVQNNFLTRAIHPTNRRMFQLTVTEKGSDTIEKLRDLVQAFRKTALDTISPDTLQETQKLLKIIVSNCKNSSD